MQAEVSCAPGPHIVQYCGPAAAAAARCAHTKSHTVVGVAGAITLPNVPPACFDALGCPARRPRLEEPCLASRQV